MKIEQLLETRKLAEWCAFLGWQGGTIHMVEQELHKRLIARCDYNFEEKQYCCILMDKNRIMFL